ncbi:MAG TPA: YD repeat-containing protein, partial [Paludibacteraceae bacterium]|nr:YD repeat-containing protein [Paludibacteraceae bacterium]
IDAKVADAKSEPYSSYSTYASQYMMKDIKTSKTDLKDTLVMNAEVIIPDSVKNAMLSENAEKNLYELLGKNVDLSSETACVLTFDTSNLVFSDTIFFAECYCNDFIYEPSSVTMTRYDETNKSNKNLTSSLYVDGLGRELYTKQKNCSGGNTYYDDGTYSSEAVRISDYKPYGSNASPVAVKHEDAVLDACGRIKQIRYIDKFGDEHFEIFERDAVGRVTRYSGSVNISYKYDNLGNIIETVDNITKKRTSYTYDNASNLVSKTTPDGDVIKYEYEYDNLTAVKYPRITSANVTNIYGNKNSSYGRRNRIALSFNSSVVDEYFYNQQGNVSKVRRTMVVPNGKILTYVTEFKYDTWGRLLEMIYPDGEILTYTFNKGGMPSRVKGRKTFDYNYIDDVEYDYLGRLTNIKFHNGTSQNVVYSSDGMKYNYTGYTDNVNKSLLNVGIGDVVKGYDENGGMAAVSNDGYLSSYFYDMSGKLAMNIGASNELVHVNGSLSGISSTIDGRHLIVNPYFEDQDSLCVKHIFLNGERYLTQVVDSFSYGAKPTRIERAGSNLDEIGFIVNYDSLHSLTANKAVVERVNTVGASFAETHVPFDYPKYLRSANVDMGEDNEEKDIYVYGVNSEGDFVRLVDIDKKSILEIQNPEGVLKIDKFRFVPLIRSNEFMKDVDNNADIPMSVLNNELHQERDAFGR